MPKNLDSPKNSPFKKPELQGSPSKVVKKKSNVPKIEVNVLKKNDSFINMLKRTGSGLQELVSPRKSTGGITSPREPTPISLKKSQKSLVKLTSKKDLKKEDKLNISPRDKENEIIDNVVDEDDDVNDVIKHIESPKDSPKCSPKVSNKVKQSPELDGRLIDEYGLDVPLMFLGTPSKKKTFFK